MTTANSKILEEKMETFHQESQERGICMQPTNITIDQIRGQLQTFNGNSSLTLVEALDCYRKRLGDAGINKQLWGGVVLSKLENPALARIPIEVKRDQKIEEIEKHLKLFYANSVATTKAIMIAHEKANTIPDPFQFPTASLKVLMMHDEVFQNSNRF